MNGFPSSDFIGKVRDAEAGVLSCLKINLLEAGAAITRAQVTPEFFSIPNRHLFEPLMSMWSDGHAFDILPLVERMRGAGTLGNWKNTADVMASFQWTSIGMLPEYLRTLSECHATRVLHTLGVSLLQEAEDPATALQTARVALDGLSIEPRTKATALRDHLVNVIQQLESSTEAGGIEFGLGLDAVAGPFGRGDLIVLAGETKKGKSALAGNIVENVAAAGGRCIVFGLEMTGAQTAERMLASQSRVDMRTLKLRLRNGVATTANDNELAALTRTVASMRDWNVDLVEDADSIPQITGSMIRFRSSGPIDLAVVDYAQLCEGIRQKGDSREREVASISRALKRAAVQCQCVVLLLSQLNDDGKLRESRALGQDANAVLAIEGEDGNMKVRVVAARSAPTGTEHPLTWKPSITRFFHHD